MERYKFSMIGLPDQLYSKQNCRLGNKIRNNNQAVNLLQYIMNCVQLGVNICKYTTVIKNINICSRNKIWGIYTRINLIKYFLWKCILL